MPVEAMFHPSHSLLVVRCSGVVKDCELVATMKDVFENLRDAIGCDRLVLIDARADDLFSSPR